MTFDIILPTFLSKQIYDTGWKRGYYTEDALNTS